LWAKTLLDHLDDAPRARLNKHRAIIYDRIAIIANTVLRWNIVIGDTCLRKNRAYSHIAFVTIGGPMFFNDIVTETRACIYAKNALHAADDPSNCAAYDCTNRTCCAFAFSSTTVDAFGHALSTRAGRGCAVTRLDRRLGISIAGGGSRKTALTNTAGFVILFTTTHTGGALGRPSIRLAVP
jgi:hypothetical protein